MSDLETALLADEGADETKQIAQSGTEREAVTFTLAKELFPSTFPQTKDVVVTLVNLTGDEEVEAIASARGNQALSNIELAKRSFARWNGRAIDRSKAEDVKLWEQMGSRCRNVCIAMFLNMWAAGGEFALKAKDTFCYTTVRV